MILKDTPAMKRLRGDKGFTLVELLVVIVIIGILVAIAIPIFLNQREAAQRKAVESDVRNAIPVMETYYSEHSSYPPSSSYDGGDEGASHEVVAGEDLKITVSSDVTITLTNNGETYEITGTHDNISGEAFSYESSAGTFGWGATAPGGE